jgi:hypothetical protein
MRFIPMMGRFPSTSNNTTRNSTCIFKTAPALILVKIVLIKVLIKREPCLNEGKRGDGGLKLKTERKRVNKRIYNEAVPGRCPLHFHLTK